MLKQRENKFQAYEYWMGKKMRKMVWPGEVPVIINIPFSVHSKSSNQNNNGSGIEVKKSELFRRDFLRFARFFQRHR